MNVLPSAPPQLYPMQELTQLNAEDFRLKKINDLLKELSDEVEHYRQVAKKYKRSHSIVHASAVGLWVTLRWALLWSLGYSIDWGRYCCQPRPCWRCHPLRTRISWLCCRQQEVGKESGQAREDLHAGPSEEELCQRTGLQSSC